MAELHILSAGAVKAGLANAASLFESETGHRVVIAFATAPVLRAQLEAQESEADVVVAPVPALTEFEGKGWVMPEPGAAIGSIKAAVVVRDGARVPDISDAVVFKKEILAARSLVYNEGSSGLYIAKLMEKLGVANEVKNKTKRFPTGGAVMQHLAASTDDDVIGFGQLTEIRVYGEQGVVLVGPLPEEIGNVTTYGARVRVDTRLSDVARAYVRHLCTPDARQCFIATGVI